MGRTINTILNLRDNFSPTLRQTSENTNKFKADLHEANAVSDKITGSFGKFAKTALGFGTALAGAGLAVATKSFIEYDNALRQMRASVGDSQDEMTNFKGIMQDIYANNFGENWEDVSNAISETCRNMDIYDNELKRATEDSLALRDTFGYEIQESTRAASMMMKQFGLTSDETFNLIAQGAQWGLDKNGNLLDSINEYSVHFKQLGFDAEDMLNIFNAGAANGIFDIDKMGDAVKEFGIRAKDGSNTTIEAFKLIGLNATEMQKAFANGGEGANSAFKEVLHSLASLEDPVKRNIAGVNLFGTMWEDLGENAILSINNMDPIFNKLSDTMGEINKIKYTSFTEVIKGVGRQLEVAALPIGEKLMPYLNDFANFLNSKLPQAVDIFTGFLDSNLDPTIEKVKKGFEDFKNILVFLKDNMNIISPVITGVVGGLTAFVVVTKVVTQGLTIAQALLNTTMLANPITWIAIGIGVLIGAFLLAYKNSETFRNGVNNLLEKLKTIGLFIKDTLVNSFNSLKENISEAWNKLKEFGAGISNTVMPVLNSLSEWFTSKILPKILEIGKNISTLWNSVIKPYSKEIVLIIQEIFNIFKPIIDSIGGALLWLWNSILQPLSQFIGSIFTSIFANSFNTIMSQVSNFISMIGGILEGLITILNGIITFIIGVFTGNWQMAWQGISDIFSGIFTTIESIAKGIVNGIINTINGIIGGINDLADKASEVPGLGWAAGINIPLIPTFAKGTNWFGGGVALVGEEGPELVNLPSGSSVKTASQTKSILNKSSQNVQVTVHVHGNFYSNDKAADELGEKIVKKFITVLENK